MCVLDRGEPDLVRAAVEYQPEDAEPIQVTRIEVNTTLDVAVLHLQRPASTALAIGPVMAGARWKVSSRPKPNDPALTGTVTDPRRRLQNDRGEETTLVQLLVDEELADYHGYSGSPVTLQPTGEVLGILVEQVYLRLSPQLGQPTPAANVLFATPIDQVVTEFGLAVTVGRPAEQIPQPVAHEVPRPDQLNRVIDALLANLTHPRPGGLLVGLVGMGGSGKSVLAAAAARNPQVRDAFPDGLFWLELGPHPPLLQLQARLAEALGDSTPITDIPEGRARLSRRFAERRCLLVLDNVWARTDLSAFAVVGPLGGLLATTRDAATVPANTPIMVDELGLAAALQLLAGWTATPGEELPAEAALVARECGYLPLALALCGAMIETGGHTWPDLLDLLRHADLEALQNRLVDYPQSLAVALGASIDTLPPDSRDRYMRLAVFDAEGPVPSAALQVLWELDQQDTTLLTEELARKSLLHVEANRVSLHDLQMDFVIRWAAGSLPTLHAQLLAAYRKQCLSGWASGPDDGYFYEHLAHHLHHADRIQELQALLLDLDWMNAKLTIGNVPGLLADYDTLPSDPILGLVAGALRLSAHVLADEPGQLPSQLTGRLTSQPDLQLHDLLERAQHWSATPWLRPLTASLTPPGGPLLRTLTAQDRPVNAVAVSADGRRAVSGGGTVKMWDLESGTPVRALTGHHGWVGAVAVSADGQRAVSGGDDETVRVWDLDSGAALHSLTGHHGWVGGVAVSADGQRAVSGGEDGTVRVWDLRSGAAAHTLTGHHGPVMAAAVSADGQRAVSGGEDGMVRVWDLDSGAAAHTLTGHHGPVYAAAVSADGRRAVSGGEDGTVRVWDLRSGAAAHTLTGHDGPVMAVAVSADGRRAVSGGEDRTVRVWDLDSGAAAHTLTGHDGPVMAVAVSADGRRAVSGGEDRTVRVWDLRSGAAAHTLTGHHGPVYAAAVSADGQRAVSGGEDRTVRAWDLNPRPTMRTLTGHRGPVRMVAVSADGQRAVSGGNDGTVRVWDLDSGAAAHTLTGHQGPVSAVAVSADGRRAVSGGEDGTVRVWDLRSAAAAHTLTGHHGPVMAVAVSADGQRAVSGDGVGTVRVWDLDVGKYVAPAGQRLRHLFARSSSHSILTLSVSADGQRAVSGGVDGMVRVWDLRSGAAVHTLTGHHGPVMAVAVSADGQRAVSGGEDGTVRVWDLRSGAAAHTLTGHNRRISAVAISADGRYAVSGGGGTVRVWDLADGAELACFISDSEITALAAAQLNAPVTAGTSTGPVHLLELCGCNDPGRPVPSAPPSTSRN